MDRKKRLLKAKNWIESYPGKNKVHGYAKQYGVDLVCAIVELRLLGVSIAQEYENAVKRSIAERAATRKNKKIVKEVHEDVLDSFSDETFAFIAGYTSGGAPYGVTHEEMENIVSIFS
ncbi:MAG: hypothetical protein V4539_06735 [Bacteroidota bacterium]